MKASSIFIVLLILLVFIGLIVFISTRRSILNPQQDTTNINLSSFILDKTYPNDLLVSVMYPHQDPRSNTSYIFKENFTSKSQRTIKLLPEENTSFFTSSEDCYPFNSGNYVSQINQDHKINLQCNEIAKINLTFSDPMIHKGDHNLSIDVSASQGQLNLLTICVDYSAPIVIISPIGKTINQIDALANQTKCWIDTTLDFSLIKKYTYQFQYTSLDIQDYDYLTFTFLDKSLDLSTMSSTPNSFYFFDNQGNDLGMKNIQVTLKG